MSSSDLMLFFGVALAMITPAGMGAEAARTTPAVDLRTTAATNVPAIPRSVFEVNEASRDPFFPNTTRLGKPKVVATNAPVQPVVPLELTLRGITGTSDRRIALINNRSIQVGEEVDFKAPNGKTICVRCVEITENSVVVIVGNSSERKELNLR